MITLDTPAKQKRFRREAIARTKHHARHLVSITPIVVEAIVRHADEGTVVGHSFRGKMTGSGWAMFRGKRVYTHYHRDLGSIVVRDKVKGGKILLSFTDKNSPTSIERQIKALRRR